ncbi:MAG: glutamate--tRNA ligase [Candidatus Diapherotrites archaeon]
MEEKVRQHAHRYAVKNAFLHSGKADLGAVVGKVIALEKGLDFKKAMPIIKEEVDKVNAMGLEEIKAAYEKFEGSYELKPKEKVPGLEPLEWAEKGEKAITRFAPNPNGPFHLGNARAAILSHEYARKYNGRFYLRFDDTDPKVKKPIANAKEVFLHDLQWLGCKVDEVFFASDRLEIYYEHMKKLIELGGAYVCSCESQKWREMTKEKKACPHREVEPKEQKKLFEQMLSHQLKEGQAVLRVKTELDHADPSIRDWWAAKIVDEVNHPNKNAQGKHVWPSYNFASAVDDHLLGTTLILRGQEHAQNQTKQEFLYTYFGWVYPHAMHFGRVKLEGMVLSTSKIAKGIEEGLYTGWDDPRLGTIKALRRRGFDPRALKEAIIEIGAKPNDATIEMSKLSDLDKKFIESESRRAAFFEEPVKLDVIYAQESEVEKDGVQFSLAPGTQTFLVPKKELEPLKEGSVIRLRQAYNVLLRKKDEFTAIGEWAGAAKKDKNIINWVLNPMDVEVLDAKNQKVLGVTEEFNAKKGDRLCFDKFGYVIVEEAKNGKINCIFTHK